MYEGKEAEQNKKFYGNSNAAVGLANSIQPDRDKSSMDVAINHLAAQIDGAEMSFHNLREKLKPIMSVRDEGGDPVALIEANCEIEERILQLARRVSVLSYQAGLASSQVCL